MHVCYVFPKLDFCTGILCILGCLEVPTQLRLILSFSSFYLHLPSVGIAGMHHHAQDGTERQASGQAHCLLSYSHGAHVEMTHVC